MTAGELRTAFTFADVTVEALLDMQQNEFTHDGDGAAALDLRAYAYAKTAVSRMSHPMS